MVANADLGFNVYALDRASKTFLGLAHNVDRLSRKLDELDRKKADPKVDVDTRGAHRNLDRLDDRLNKLSFRKVVINTAVALGPAALPAAAGLGALASLGAGATAGITAFAATAVQSMKRVTEARKELAKADTDHTEILQGLSTAQRQSVRDVDRLAESFSRFQDSTDPAILGALGSGMVALENAMPAVAPLVERSASAFDDFFVTVGQQTGGGQFAGWTADMADLASDTLPQLGDAAIDTAYGVGRMVTAFGGLGRGAAAGIADIAGSFAEWTEGRGLTQLVSFTERTAPELMDTLGEVGEAMLNLVEAAGPLASPLLAIAKAGASIVNTLAEVHPGLLTAGIAIASFTSASRVLGSGLTAANIRMKAFRAEIAALPTTAGRARSAMGLLTSSMGGKSGVATAAGISALALSGMADQTSSTGKALGVFGNVAGGALMGFGVGGPWGAAIGGGIGLLTGLGQAFLSSGDSAESSAGANDTYTSSLNRVNGAITNTTREMVAQQLEQQGILQQLMNAGLDPGLGVEAVLGDPSAIRQVTAAYDQQISSLEQRSRSLARSEQFEGQNAAALRDTSVKLHNLKIARDAVVGALRGENKELEANQAAFRRTSAATDGYEQATGKARITTTSLSHAVRGLMKAQHDQAMAALAASDKNIAYQQALDDAAEEARKGARTLDITTQAGRDNRVALNGIAAAWNDLGAAAQSKHGAFRQAKQDFIDVAVQMGATRKQAERLAEKLLEQPKRVVTKAELERRDAERDLEALRRKYGDIPSNVTTKAQFDKRQGVSQAQSWFHDVNGILGRIPDEPVNVELTGLAKLALTGAGPLMRKAGGPIPGWMGERGKDSVPVLTMPDEHVVTTAEVRAAGRGSTTRGHRIWEGIRHAALMGALPDPMDLPKYEDGGAVAVRPNMTTRGFPAAAAKISGAFGSLVAGISQRLSDKINEMFRFGGGRPLGPGGSLSAGQLMMGQRAVSGEVGKPYVWGGVGPGGYDCSGLQSFAYNSAVGRSNPHVRIGSTGTMPWPGMAPGTGGYTLGWFTGDPGHTSGNMGGLNIESAGGVGVRTGGSARSPLDAMFNHVGHYDRGGRLRPGKTLAVNDSGEDELILTSQQAKVIGRQFSVGRASSRRDVRSEIHELTQGLRDHLGKDSPLLDRVGRMGDRMEKVAGRLQDLNRTSEKLERRMEKLQQAREQLATSVRDQFRNDAFGGGLADLSLQLRADRNDARAMEKALRRAKGKGLSGALFRSLAESGNLLLAQEFAGLSRGRIRHFEQLFAQRQGASTGVGRMAAATIYGREVKETRRETRHNTRALNRNTRAIEKQERRLEHAVAKGVREGSRRGGARQRARSR